VIEARLRPKLIELPLTAIAELSPHLRAGRLPERGKDEVLAGSQEPRDEHLSVGDRTLRVVGGLEPGVGLFEDCYLVAADKSLDGLFPAEDPAVRRVDIVRMTANEFAEGKSLAQLAEVYPSKSFAILAAEVRSNPAGFALYLLGQAIFLLGGCGLLVGFYRWLALRVSWPMLAEPLGELAVRPRLLWGVHLIYFGIFVAAALMILQAPALNTVLMTSVQGQLSGQTPGVLAVAGQAYASGNMAYAALVTFVINFVLGSLAMITLPSLIIPGLGALLAAVRAAFWGLLLGPFQVDMAYRMLAHTGTLLLEGEGYILATFFALLIPIYIFGLGRSSKYSVKPSLAELEPSLELQPQSTAWSRYKDAAILNLKASVLVAAVLAVAACYEAVEVIRMAGL
jgi:hypothetical protein